MALSTTKRKFHKILDSISNASSVSLVNGNEKYNASSATLPASTDPPAKRSRVARPASAYVPSRTQEIKTSAREARPLSVIQQPAAATMNEEKKPPNFAPWDRGQFLDRLKTYRHVDKWRGKPEKISEVEWSKRGWSCVGKERVGCVGGCGKEIFIMLESRPSEEPTASDADKLLDDDGDEDDWREKARMELIDKYAELMITAHDTGCLWRRRGCDGRTLAPKQPIKRPKKITDTIQRLPLAHQGTAIENLRQRYTSLTAMSSELPPNPSIPNDFDPSDIHEQMLALLDLPHTKPQKPPQPQTEANSSDAPSVPSSPSRLDSPAMLLALFGWQAEEGHIKGLATCHACFRRLGLWLFKPSPDSSAPASMERLDIVGEHRDYCPWINRLSQNGTASRRTSLDGLAGWQVLVRNVQASTLYKKFDKDEAPAAAVEDTVDDTASTFGSTIRSAQTKEDRKDQDEKDKERWAKLKRLKQVFHVKRNKGREQKERGP